MDDKAQGHFDKAMALHKSGDYRQAAPLFKKAAELWRKDKHRAKRRDALAWQATSLRMLRMCAEALRVYEDEVRPLTVALYIEGVRQLLGGRHRVPNGAQAV